MYAYWPLSFVFLLGKIEYSLRQSQIYLWLEVQGLAVKILNNTWKNFFIIIILIFNNSELECRIYMKLWKRRK